MAKTISGKAAVVQPDVGLLLLCAGEHAGRATETHSRFKAQQENWPALRLLSCLKYDTDYFAKQDSAIQCVFKNYVIDELKRFCVLGKLSKADFIFWCKQNGTTGHLKICKSCELHVSEHYWVQKCRKLTVICLFCAQKRIGSNWNFGGLTPRRYSWAVRGVGGQCSGLRLAVWWSITCTKISTGRRFCFLTPQINGRLVRDRNHVLGLSRNTKPYPLSHCGE